MAWPNALRLLSLPPALMKTRPCLLLLAACLWSLAAGAEVIEPARWELTVDGVAREALIQAPTAAKTTPTPVVFVFHGHGGTARGVMRSFPMAEQWPEAIAVAMQGLPTPGRLTDPEGKKNGWQHSAGDQGDRDLKFFDAVLERLRQEYKIDAHRIYSTGHSNGGGFTYLLWAQRGDVLAAVAPCASAVLKDLDQYKPKPAMHIAGKADPLVKFEWQEQTIANFRKVNQCAPEGTAWAADCTLYPSGVGAPFVAYIHDGGHVVPKEAPALVAKFFREHPGTETRPATR